MSASGNPGARLQSQSFDLQFRDNLDESYADVFTGAAKRALMALAPFEGDRRDVMARRIRRRASRARNRERLQFLDDDPEAVIPRTRIKVRDARSGSFVGSEIPGDLQRQWIQGTGPAAKPNAPLARSLRNPAYALLSGADGWMFDGEDALGQITTMSLDNQRNLKLAIDRDPAFMKVADDVAGEMNRWAEDFLGRRIIDDWRRQLDFTTKIFRPRGLHLADRHVRCVDGTEFSARLSTSRCTWRTITRRCAAPARRSCCTSRRSRPPRKRRCGTISSLRSKCTSGCGSARSRCTSSSSSSKRAFS
jgi:malate synthase